jgi:hypothetical protein
VKGFGATVGEEEGAADVAMAGSDICRFPNELRRKNVKPFLWIGMMAAAAICFLACVKVPHWK